MSKVRAFLYVMCILSVAASVAAVCGTSAVVGDVANTLVGHIVQDGVKLDWETDDETSEVEEYKIYRYKCADPSTCSVYVTTITATGSCGTTEDYTHTDDPPDPDSDWTYTVEIWTSSERAGSVDVVPEP